MKRPHITGVNPANGEGVGYPAALHQEMNHIHHQINQLNDGQAVTKVAQLGVVYGHCPVQWQVNESSLPLAVHPIDHILAILAIADLRVSQSLQQFSPQVMAGKQISHARRVPFRLQQTVHYPVIY
jgi:hypothetical protein